MLRSWLNFVSYLRQLRLVRLPMLTLTARPSALTLCAGLTLCACGNQGFDSKLLASEPAAITPQLSDPPKWMTTGCPAIKALPDKAATQNEVEGMWNFDVEGYETCRLKYYALRNYYRKRDEALRAAR